MANNPLRESREARPNEDVVERSCGVSNPKERQSETGAPVAELAERGGAIWDEAIEFGLR